MRDKTPSETDIEGEVLRMWVRRKDPNRSVLLGIWGPGVAPGDETDEKLPMNPEVAEVDVSQSVGASQTTYAKPHEYTLRECCPNTKQAPSQFTVALLATCIR